MFSKFLTNGILVVRVACVALVVATRRGVVESLLAGSGLMKRKDVWWIDEEEGCVTKVRNDGTEERRTGGT